MVKATCAHSGTIFRTLQILIVLIAFFLRTWELDRRSLWFDEGMEYWVATAPPAQLLASVQRGIQDPPLYSALLHLWMGLGRAEFQLRLLSVVAGTLSVATMFLIGRRSGLRMAGLIAALLLALLPGEIRYAQEVGQYSLMLCLLSFTTALWLDASRSGRGSVWFGWLGLAVAATYAYYGAVFLAALPVAVSLVMTVARRQWIPARRIMAAALGYVLCVAPLALFFLPHQLLRGPTAAAGQPSFAAPWAELQHFIEATQTLLAFQFTGWPWTSLPAWLSATAILFALTCAAVYAATERNARLLCIALGTTIAGYYLVSRWNLFPYGYRYGLILTPLLLPAIGVGIASLWMRRRQSSGLALLGALLLCALVGVEMLSLPHQGIRRLTSAAAVSYSWPEEEELRPLAAYWLGHRKPGQITYVYYGAVPGFRYYLGLLGADRSSPPASWFLDCWRSSAPGYCQSGDVYFGRSLRAIAPADKVRIVTEQLPANFAGGWLIFSHVVADEQASILRGLADEYTIVEQKEAPGAALFLLERH
jgi:hypothetical protein